MNLELGYIQSAFKVLLLLSKFHSSRSANTNRYYGSVLNPWSTTDDHFESQIPGGSSGGSASAVAAHLCFRCPLTTNSMIMINTCTLLFHVSALGSDTGGSVRCPASFCGVVGYKPSYGRSSRHGLIPLANSLDCPGLIARSVEDAGLLADVISGHDPQDATSAQQPCLQITRNLQEMRDVAKPLQGVRIGIPKVYPYSCLFRSCY